MGVSQPLVRPILAARLSPLGVETAAYFDEGAEWEDVNLLLGWGERDTGKNEREAG